MELNERKRKILAAIIDDYIETAEPVGSVTIAQKAGLGLSSATVRNEMAELTALGYLEQPHKSAGRVPSHLGYRLYVNELMRRHRITVEEAETINREFKHRMTQFDTLMSDIGVLAARLTRYPALTMMPPSKATILRFDLIYVDTNTFIIVVMLSNNTVRNKLIRLAEPIENELLIRLSSVFNAHFTGITEELIGSALVSSAERAAGDTAGVAAAITSFVIEILCETGTGEAYVTGASRLMDQPEFRDPDKIQRLLTVLSDSDRLLSLPAPDGDGSVKVSIGSETLVEELRDSSIVIVSFDAGNSANGLVGIVGPTRMDYSRVAARLKYFADTLSRILRGDLNFPSGWSEYNSKGEDQSDE